MLLNNLLLKTMKTNIFSCILLQALWAVTNEILENVITTPALQFSTLLINTGNIWVKTLNSAIITVGGYYYVSLSISGCYKPFLKAQVVVNNNVVLFEINFLHRWNSYYHMTATTREQSTIVLLNAGDSISVSIPSSPTVCIFSSVKHFTGFFGFLLSPQ